MRELDRGERAADPTLSTILVLAGGPEQSPVSVLEDWAREEGSLEPWVLALAGVHDVHASVLRAFCDELADRAPTRVVTVETPSVADILPAALREVDTEWCVVAAGNAHPVPGWWTGLRRSIGDLDDATGIIQPVVLQEDGTVASAGGVVVLPEAELRPHLRGWPVGHAIHDGDLIVPAPLAPVVAARTSDLRAVSPWAADGDGGLGEAALASALRARGRTVCRVSAGSRVIGRSQARAGLRGSRRASDAVLLDTHAREGVETLDPRPARTPPLRPGPRLPLVWTIGTSVPNGQKGFRWGDTAFAEALARSIRGLGHEVSVDTLAARSRRTQARTDVAVTLRGLERQAPVPGAVNVLWVISHPDLVTREEALEYDLVFAASALWAERTSAEWDLEVRTLLQATDPSVFKPGPDDARNGDVVFVGTAVHGRRRDLVERAMAQGVDVVLVGPGWSHRNGSVIAEHQTSEQVARLYAASEAVLCDHWEDMRREGFVANRVLDALGAGAAVVSDVVPGIMDVAPDGIVVLGPEDDVAAGVVAARRVDRETRLRVAEHVARWHSFAERARELDRAVHQHLARERRLRRQPERSTAP